MRQYHEWGTAFQLRLLSLLVKHPSESYDLIESGYFKDPIQVDIAKVAKDAYRGNLNSTLSKSTLLALVKKSLHKADRQYWSNYREAIHKIFKYPLTDKDILLKQALDFAKETKYRDALIQVEKNISAHRYGAISRTFSALEDFGVAKDLGLSYWEGIKDPDRYTTDRENIIPTGFPRLDRYMGGGAAAGELVIILGGGKVGKTTMLGNIAAGGIKYGKNVAIATGELSDKKYRKRVDSLISRIPAKGFGKKSVREEVIKRLLRARKIMRGKLFIRQWPTGRGSTDDIDAWLKDLDSEGIRIDELIVDYTRLFRPSFTHKELRHNLGQVCVDLRGIGGAWNIPVITASQPNRAGLDKETLGPEDFAEDISQFWTLDFLVALCQTKEERAHEPPRGRALLAAARDVGRGGVIPLEIDYNTYRIMERHKDKSDDEIAEMLAKVKKSGR